MKKINILLCTAFLIVSLSACNEQALNADDTDSQTMPPEIVDTTTRYDQPTTTPPEEPITTLDEITTTEEPNTTTDAENQTDECIPVPTDTSFPEDSADSDYLSTVKLYITEVYDSFFIAENSIFTQDTYSIPCEDASTFYSVGDYVEVNYYERTPSVDYTYELEADSIMQTSESEYMSMDLLVTEFCDGYFTATLTFPYYTTYNVYYPESLDMKQISVGSSVNARYTEIIPISEDELNIRAFDILLIESDYVLDTEVAYKPVIYLYPESETAVDVKLFYNGELTVTYPQYDNGWSVIAEPDGTLWQNGREYSYLFWEGKDDTEYDFSSGFCVKGSDTAEFLREKLELLGLTPREYNEFIVFWLPHMLENEYNIISFQTDRYTENAVLEVSPEPDTVLRVFMAFYPSESPVELPEQVLETTERVGFTVVEWGGTKTK